MMMSSEFGPWESSDTANNSAAKPPVDDPLAVFESAGGGGGGANDAMAHGHGGADADLLGTGGVNDIAAHGGGTVDLLGTGSPELLPMGSSAQNDVRATGDAALFGEVEGKVEHELEGFHPSDDDDDDPNDTIEIHEENSQGGDDDDLLDIEGWNLRRHRSDPQEGDYGYDPNGAGEPEADGYGCGTDDKTPAMEANARGERNNGRRGLFGRWGSRRNDKSSASSESEPPFQSYADGRGPDDCHQSKLPRDGSEGATLAFGEGGITGDVVDGNADADADAEADLEDEQKMDNRLRPGDHIYIWQTYGINPRAYQRHAVVCSVTRRSDVDPLTLPPPQGPSGESHDEPLSFDMEHLYDDDEDDGIEVTVVSFYHFSRLHQNHGAAQAAAAASGNRRGKRRGSRREHLIDFIGPDGINRKKPIHKVRYGRKVKKGLLSQKAGVGTALKKDRVGLILARVQYVLEHPDHLPAHNALSANGECASLWCVTGKWCTLQGASILAITTVGQAGGALLAGGILSNLTILVPMPGVWGMAGWWWYVPATVAYPFLVPMLVALGMASLVPLEILRRNRKKWRGITDGLNHEFWSDASEATREEYFGQMATAEREAEMRTFFGVREGEATADDAKYMPVGGAPGGPDDDDEDEAEAMRRMERSCKDMEATMDLSGKPPEGQGGGQRKGWGSFFRRNDSGASPSLGNENAGSGGLTETQRFRATSDYS